VVSGRLLAAGSGVGAAARTETAKSGVAKNANSRYCHRPARPARWRGLVNARLIDRDFNMQDPTPSTPADATTPAAPSAWVAALGYGGLLPFCLLALAVFWAGGEGQAFYGFALLAYGATVASFLGAIHWGLAMRSGAAQSSAYLWGVAPSLVAWTALLQPTPWGLELLAGLLLLCYGVDRRLYAHYALQAWLPLRMRLTVVASCSCLAAAWGLTR